MVNQQPTLMREFIVDSDALIELTAHGRAEALNIGQRLRTPGSCGTPKVYCLHFGRSKQTCEELLRGLGYRRMIISRNRAYGNRIMVRCEQMKT